MKPNKTIFLIISVFALIAVAGYGTHATDDGDLGDGRCLTGLIPDPDNGAGGNDFDLNNIGLFIDDRQLLHDSQLFFALDTGSDLPPGEDGDGNPGRRIQKGNPVVTFGGDGTYEFVFQFNFPNSINNITQDFIDSAQNKATYTIDKKVFSMDDSGPLRNDGWPTAQYNSSYNLEPWQPLSIANTPLAAVTASYTRDTNPSGNFKSNQANNFLEGAVDMDLLVAELSSLGESTGTVNFFWTLSYNNDEPFVRASNQ